MNEINLLQRLLAWAVGLMVFLVGAVSFASAIPSLHDADLGRGPFSRMHMLLEKTILAVDVANIEVRVDLKAEKAFEQIAKGKPLSPELEKQLADAMFATENAVFQVQFLRDISLQQYVTGVRESLDEAHAAGIIDSALRQRVSAGLPEWFKPLKDRGLQDGDRVIYRITPLHLRTAVITGEGQVLVDRTDQGADKRLIVLGSYFAPGTDYRDALLRSLAQ